MIGFKLWFSLIAGGALYLITSHWDYGELYNHWIFLALCAGIGWPAGVIFDAWYYVHRQQFVFFIKQLALAEYSQTGGFFTYEMFDSLCRCCAETERTRSWPSLKEREYYMALVDGLGQSLGRQVEEVAEHKEDGDVG